MQTAGPVNRLEIFDAADSVKYDEIAGKLKIETGRIDIIGSAKLTAEALADCPDAVEFAIAYGAAIAHLDLPNSASFRSDFMPYQGRKAAFAADPQVFRRRRGHSYVRLGQLLSDAGDTNQQIPRPVAGKILQRIFSRYVRREDAGQIKRRDKEN